MKLLIVLSLVAIAVAAPPSSYRSIPDKDVETLRYENDNVGFGNYRFYYEQSDGTAHEQKGQLRNEGREDETYVVQGSYTWYGPDGVKYIVTYTADENGYKPEIEEGPGGAVPPAVVASLLG